MASDRREYFKKYDNTRKESRKKYDAEKAQKQKEEKELAKYQELKAELEETKSTNTWFDPNRNPYFDRLNSEDHIKYVTEKRKRFMLQFEMDNPRKKGDSKDYNNRRENAYLLFKQNQDLFHRIQYYRVFRRIFKSRMNNISPDKGNQMMNNCFIPEELNPDSYLYDPKLLHLLDEGVDSDPPLKVLIPSEWAQKLIDEDSSDSWDSDFDGT